MDGDGNGGGRQGQVQQAVFGHHRHPGLGFFADVTEHVFVTFIRNVQCPFVRYTVLFL